MRHRWKRIFLAAAAVCLLSGCQKEPDGEAVHSPVPEQEQAEHPEEEKQLNRAVQAVESQFPDRKFEPLSEDETEQAVSFFEDSYLFTGRKAQDGYSYILGICLAKENPLEGMTCGKDWSGEGYSASQFHGGQFLLLEKGDTSSGISVLYPALEEGMDGISYLEEAAERGAYLVQPQEEGFRKTYAVQKGKLYTEYIKTDVSAAEDPGFSPESLGENGTLLKGELSGTFEGGIRTESLGNREDLEKLGELLSEAEKKELPMNEYFPGKLTLTMESGETKELWLSFPAEGQMPELFAGGDAFYTWKEEQHREIWQLFGTVYGFGAYGDQIWMEMDPGQMTEEDPELSFILHNDTGRSIQYILSPVIEKKTEKDGEESWEQVESLAGFCGYLTELSEESVRLAVPWKGSFAPDGPGTYRLRIQVLAKEELRFGVEAEFEVADHG